MSASTVRKQRQAAREAGTDKKMLAAQEAAKKQNQSKRRWTFGTVCVVLLIAAILLLNSGLVYKLTAFTVDNENYTAAEVNYHYASQYYYLVNQYGSYISLFGLDTSTGLQGLDKQPCSMGEGSWKDYFIDGAENEITQIKILKDYAAENGIVLTDADLANVDASFEGIDDYAKSQGFANADRFFAANYGEGVNTNLVRESYKDSALAGKALTALTASFDFSADEIKVQYDSYEGNQDFYDYEYFFVSAETVETTAEDGSTKNEVTEETLAAAKADADAILAAYNETEGTDYAARLTEAVGSVVEGAAAYDQTNVAGSNLGDYKAWMMESGRQAGDAAVIANSGDTGYYVVVFVSHNDNNYKTASVRHILIEVEADENGVYTDEAKAAAKARAEEVLAEFNSGDKSEDSFAALAEQYSSDAGSNTNGGLYTNIAKGQMVPEFDAFCFAGHKPGDTGIVYGETGSYAGYHVMYYVGEGEVYRDYIALNDLRNTAVNEWLTDKTAAATTSEGFGMKFVG